MRILAVIITTPQYKASGGVGAGLQLSQALVDKVSIEVAIMSEKQKIMHEGRLLVLGFESINILGICRQVLPRQFTSLYWRNPLLQAHIKKTKPDLVHIHNPHPAGALWETCKTCKRARIPYVLSGHGFVELSNFTEAAGLRGLKKIIAEWTVNRPFSKSVSKADMIFMTSPYESQILHSIGIPKKKYALVTNGVDSFFKEKVSPEDKMLIARRFALKPDIPSFLFVGNHTYNKGIDLFLEAMHLVDIQSKAVIAGSIRSQEDHKTLCLKHRVNELGQKVVFTDFLTKEELRVLYQTVDCFVFPSRADTLPLVILEAMASGLPVIATRVGGIPYQVDDSNGILISPNNTESLAKAISTLAKGQRLRKKLGEAGRERITDRFDWRKSADAAVYYYQKILEMQMH